MIECTGTPLFDALRYTIQANSYQFVAIQWLVRSDVSLVASPWGGMSR